MKQRIKRVVFGLVGKDPEAVVVSFLSGDPAAALRMVAEMRELLPGRRHFAVVQGDGCCKVDGVEVVRVPGGTFLEVLGMVRRKFRPFRIGAAAVLFDGMRQNATLRRVAFFAAPTKILAFNRAGERHHLRLRTGVASWLFWRGVPLDRIFLRPWWLYPLRRDRTGISCEALDISGRARREDRPLVAIVTPYAPYPLSHGGAVRMFSLMRECAAEFDLSLITFARAEQTAEWQPLLEICTHIAAFPLPYYREPRWSSLMPPEAAEFSADSLKSACKGLAAKWDADLVQVEFSQLADYSGDILVEHDVTFDLFRQMAVRSGDRAARMNFWRWQRFEAAAVKQFRRVVVMSGKDAEMLPGARTAVIPNGVDTRRFVAGPEKDGRELLFIGSFRHFPNIAAYRFFIEEVLPLVPDVRVTVVAGPDAELYWQQHTGSARWESKGGVTVLGFVADVRPLYEACQLVLVPTTVSAGTNLKVLEAMAMQRAVVSTSSGCGGIDVTHGSNVWIADDAGAFAEGVRRLLADDDARRSIARNGRALVERKYDWTALAKLQTELWKELLQ